MQSHRPRLPVVEDVSVLDVLATEPGVALADRSGDAPALERATTILVGPEGGWTDDERRLVEQRVVLGGHVLRAETTAITAGVVLTALRARLVGPAS
jgi:RsmE family RNA methyltransferase